MWPVAREGFSVNSRYASRENRIAGRLSRVLLAWAAGLFLAFVAMANDWPMVEKGFKPERAFAVGEIDNIRLLNGGLELAIPLGHRYPVGEAGLNYGFTLHYGSQLWEYTQQYISQTDDYRTAAYPVGGSNAGFGWRLSMGEFWPTANVLEGRFCGMCYIDSSGARHRFTDRLHHDIAGQTGRWFSTDGTFLRLTQVTGGWEIEFPSGEVHDFDAQGRLVLIRDQFFNWISVEWAQDGSSWTVRDSEGRMHTVQLVSVPNYGKAVHTLKLSAFGGTNEATYDFTYETPFVPRSCLDDYGSTSATVQLPILTAVSIPDGGSSYAFPLANYFLQADPSCGTDGAARQGLLQKVVFPTLGSVEWAYIPYFFPVPTDASPDTDFPPTWLSAVAGVGTRTIRSAAETAEGTWSYGQTLANGSASLESVTSVITPLGDKTEHFFNVGQTTSVTYGLSFTPLTNGLPDRSDLFLSTKSYDWDSEATTFVLKRSTYVKYSAGVGDPSAPSDANPRVEASGVRFHDDSNRWAAVDYSTYDGLGHFRQEMTSGNYPAGNERTTITSFNPLAGNYPGSFSLPGANANWILNTFDSAQVTEAGVTARSEYCFDSNGFLSRVRTLKAGTTRGNSDLLTVFVAGSEGERAEEHYYGGDVAHDVDTDATTPLCTLAVASAEQYQIRNSIHGGDNQALATSRHYDGSTPLPFYSAKRDVDPRTGLVAKSYDISDIGTSYEYDLLGRLTWVKPDTGHDGTTEYKYTRATTSSALAKLEILRRGNEIFTGNAMAESFIDFDGFGRVTSESRRLPGTSSWSSRATKYNAQGLLLSVSEWGNSAKKTTYGSYDAFGRPGTITPPDGAAHAVGFQYTGDREVKRTTKVATDIGDLDVIIESDSITTETYDRQGRLYQVKEPSGTNGADVTTTYAYDVGGRLNQASTTAGVTQVRNFVYDNRGFLVSEQHPEKGGAAGGGTVQYQLYDARGHATRKIDGPNDLTFEFDKAERLRKVRETSGAARLLKEFTYSSVAGPSLGKLWTADRYNYVTIGGTAYTGRVEELYTYSGRGGRVSDRQTDFYIGATLTNTWKQAFEYTPLGETDVIDYPYCFAGSCVSGGATRRKIEYGFSRGWLTSIADYQASNWAGVNYHANGQVNQIAHRNNVVVSQVLDASYMSRPASISTSGVAGGGNWQSGQYTFDGSGNVVWIGGSLYLYDKVSRVKSASVMFTPAGFVVPPHGSDSPDTQLIFADGFESGNSSAWTEPTGPTSGTQNFSYDAFGNLLGIAGASGLSIPVNTATNRLNPNGTNPYDTAGNMTSWNGNTYSYGPFNETWRVVTSNQEWVHIYTADDERLFSYQVVGGPQRRWTLRGLDNRVLREYVFDQTSGTGVLERDNVYRGPGPLLAAATPAGDRHYHVDHLGTPRQITDAAGAQVAFHTYYPYGEEATGPTQDTVRFKFTGHERDLADPTTTQDDLDNMHARMTNPKLGRFLSPDPVGGRSARPQSWNRYSYVDGNPLILVDGDGRTENYMGREYQPEIAARQAAAPLLTGAQFADQQRRAQIVLGPLALFFAPFLATGTSPAVGAAIIESEVVGAFSGALANLDHPMAGAIVGAFTAGSVGRVFPGEGAVPTLIRGGLGAGSSERILKGEVTGSSAAGLLPALGEFAAQSTSVPGLKQGVGAAIALGLAYGEGQLSQSPTASTPAPSLPPIEECRAVGMLCPP